VALTEKEKERIDYFYNLAKSKEYRNETIEMAIMLAHTKEAVAKCGSIRNAFEEVIKLCEKHDNSKEFINAVGILIGIA
jgi:hypothetical protein